MRAPRFDETPCVSCNNVLNADTMIEVDLVGSDPRDGKEKEMREGEEER